MFCSLHISLLLSLAGTLTLNAGLIQVGSGTNGANGLTRSYMNSAAGTLPTPASSTTCIGTSNSRSTSGAGWNNCLTPPAGGASSGATTAGTSVTAERAYQATLFENATNAPSVATEVAQMSLAGFAHIANVSPDTGLDGWVTGAANKTVVTDTPASSDLVVAVGVFGVDKIYTMLNDYWGATGVNNTTLEFKFSTTSNGSGATTVESVALTNGQQIRSVVKSDTVALTCSAAYVASACPSVGAPIATSLTSGPVTIGNAQVTASNVFESVRYGNAPGIAGAASQYAGINGTMVLDSQLFDFGTLHTNEYLVSITIRNQLASTQIGTSTNQTRVALSAVSVNQVVPEPGTIVLSLAGLGALAYFRRRRA